MTRKHITLTLLSYSFVFSQTYDGGNISISALGNLSISSQDTAFRSHGLEIVIMGKINPNTMVMAYVTNHLSGEGSTAEEFYANFEDSSDFISSYKIGYFRPNFGIMNRQHEHTYNFMNSPKSISRLFGNHGWASLGVSSQITLPLKWDNYINISIMQDSFGEDINLNSHNHSQAISSSDTVGGFSYAARFDQSYFIRKSTNIALGFNYLTGRDKESMSVDFVLKSRANKYQYFLIQSEYYSSKISSKNHGIAFHPDEELASWYAIVGKQFDKKYHFGFLADYFSYRLKGEKSIALGFYGTIAPFDDSTVLRIKFMNEPNVIDGNYLALSVVWSVGSHKPQRY